MSTIELPVPGNVVPSRPKAESGLGQAGCDRDAVKAGTSKFLFKDVRHDQPAEAFRTFAAGDALLHPTLTRRLVERFVYSPPLRQLQPGRLRVDGSGGRGLAKGGRGLTDAELFLGEATVKTLLASCADRTEPAPGTCTPSSRRMSPASSDRDRPSRVDAPVATEALSLFSMPRRLRSACSARPAPIPHRRSKHRGQTGPRGLRSDAYCPQRPQGVRWTTFRCHRWTRLQRQRSRSG